MAANRVMTRITKWLESHLRVKVNVTKTKVAKPKEIKFLGFGFYFNKKENKWRPSVHPKSVTKLKFKLMPLLRRKWGVSLSYRIQRINQVTRGWVNYFKIADMKSVLDKIDVWIRTHIRMIMWKQWKTPRNREKQLIKLGMPKYRAKPYSNTRRSYKRTSMWLGRWINNDVIKSKGLLSLKELYITKRNNHPCLEF